jgi:hypothetical protein
MVLSVRVAPISITRFGGVGGERFRSRAILSKARDKFDSVAAAHVLRIGRCCHHRSNQFTQAHWPGSAPFCGGWCAEPPNRGLNMSQILKFSGNVSRRTPEDGTLEEAVAGTEAKMPSLPIMTGDQWNEFIRLLTPEERQAFMADVWKLINLYCRRIGGWSK